MIVKPFIYNEGQNLRERLFNMTDRTSSYLSSSKLMKGELIQMLLRFLILIFLLSVIIFIFDILIPK